MNGQQIIKCPQCGSNKVKGAGTTFKGMIAVGILCCVTIIGLPLGIVFILAAFIMKYSKTRLKFRCQECNHDFKVSPQLFEEYKVAVNKNDQVVNKSI